MDSQTHGMTFGQQASLVVKVLSWLFVCWLMIALIAETRSAKEESVKNGKAIDQILKRMNMTEAGALEMLKEEKEFHKP